ncbi:MAG TPA: hypothetical protein VFQ19_02540, partial [Nocardioidaceae bacterium]|nr:hypothetical protein [Nocardioidaceae bacterium]
LLAAFAQFRARGPKNNNDAADVGSGGDGASAGHSDGETAGDGAKKNDGGGSDESADSDELPIGEGDVHPADNDADDAKNPEDIDEGGACASCGMSGDPTAFVKPRPFRPGELDLFGDASGSTGGGDPSAGGRGAGGRGYSFDWAKLLPQVHLYLHVAEDTLVRDAGGVVRWEGHGPVSWQYVLEQLMPLHRFAVKPVIDLAKMAPVDAYEIPHRHREAVHLQTPADIFPYSSNTTRSKQIDHTVPYRLPEQGGGPGQSRLGNYGPMVTFHHRIKTFGAWELRQPFQGIYLWKSPTGEHYLVDHTGTRRVGKRPGAGRGGEAGPGGRDGPGDGARTDESADREPAEEPTEREWADIAIQVYLGRDPIDYEYSHAS